MKKAQIKNDAALRAEYDFSRGVRGKHTARFARGANIVALAPDVARVFRDERSVNEALRALARIVGAQIRNA